MLAVVVFGPSGPVGSRVAAWYAGWRDALASLPGDGDEGAGATAEATEVLFDSGEHPDTALSLMVRVESGLFTQAGGLVVLDYATVLAVDLASRTVRATGREGDGPGEFKWPATARLARMPSGFAIWDGGSHRVNRYSPDGEFLEASTLSAAMEGFKQGMREPAAGLGQFADRLAALATSANPPTLLGGFGDGALLFLRSQGQVNPPGGRSRRRASLFERLPNDSVRMTLEFPGHEIHATVRPNSSSSGPIVFGHRTLVALAGDGIVFADTESDEIVVRARDGGELWAFPMPGERVAVTQAQVEANQGGDQRRLPPEIRARFRGRGEPRPHNPVAPPVDAVMTDMGGRVWVREYVLPGAETQRWTVWERGGKAFAIGLPVDDKLLDARGDRILVRVRDPDRDRVEVRRIAH